jgi:uncharacterized protein YegL
MNELNLNVGKGLKFNNFDPDTLDSDETINVVFVVDVSPSIIDFESELNAAFNEFVQEMQKSHVSNRLLVSTLEFSEKVYVNNGFQPIVNIPVMNFHGKDSGTALYDASLLGIENAVSYRETLLNSGINAKTLVFIFTDGQDNSSKTNPDKIKTLLTDLAKDEKNAFSFTTILFGIGRKNQNGSFENEQYFTDAAQKMGIKNLAKVGNTAKELRKMVGFISSSISTTSSGQQVSTVAF